MKIRPLFLLCFILFYLAVNGETFGQKFDRTAFYKAIKSDKTDVVNDELTVLSASPPGDKDAFEGALQMRKAGLVKIPAEKLKLFKTGRIKLETVLLKDSANAEYRFLRLIIQEHAPKIVKYSKDLQSDKLYIQKHYRSLLSVTQDAVADYCETSKVLSMSKLRDGL